MCVVRELLVWKDVVAFLIVRDKKKEFEMLQNATESFGNAHSQQYCDKNPQISDPQTMRCLDVSKR